jgi:hypothetical protein
VLDLVQANRALERLADSFLTNTREVPGTGHFGWGQFVGPTAGTQVGLYGTCAGLIVVASAYTYGRIPQCVIRYLTQLWRDRNTAGTDGARYFALTARLAFFLMALRHGGHPSLAPIMAEADQDLRTRILDDGLFVSWQIDQNQKGATGDEFSTAIAVLAYGLTTRVVNDVPAEIRRSAETLQTRIEGSVPPNVGVRKFYLAAVTIALDERLVSRRITGLVRLGRVRDYSRDQDSLYFWDYWYLGPAGKISRRDYFHVPSDAVDILVACGSTAGRFQKLAALDLAEKDVKSVLDLGLFFAGRELAGSNSQAWMSLAISRAKLLRTVDTPFNRIVMRYIGGVPENVLGSVIFPATFLALMAVASTTPDKILELLQWMSWVGPKVPPWWTSASVALQAVGVIVLAAWGQSLVLRTVAFVWSRLP